MTLVKHYKTGPHAHDQRTHGKRGKNKAGLSSSAKFVAPKNLLDGVAEWMSTKAKNWLDPFPDADFASVRQSHGRQMAIADAYDALPNDDPRAHASYAAMGRDVEDQYNFLTGKLGIRMIVQGTDPYPDVQAMVADVANNGRLRVLSTASTGGHPFFSNEQNDKFRFVHDAFGHAATGRGFDRHGEEAAWQSHVRMFSPEARPAMTSETRGQNASLIKNGTFPPQKVAVLPNAFQKGVHARLSELAVGAVSLGIEPARALEIAKHLKGRHDQKNHGKRGPKRLQRSLNTAGGFSYQPLVNSSPLKGFAVAILPKAEQIFEGIPSVQQIADFVQTNSGRVRNQRLHLGGWYDSEADKTYLDVSVVVPEEDQAHRIARRFDQLAIFDLGAGEEQRTEDRPRKPSAYQQSGVGKRRKEPASLPGAHGRTRSTGSARRVVKASRQLEVERIDEDRRQVFGWALVAKIGDLEVIDSQGDLVDIEDLEKAAYDFVLTSRDGADMHITPRTGTLIESMVFTPEKIEKLGLEADMLPQGWWVGFQVTDEATWRAIKSGRRKGFSIGGSGYRVPMEVSKAQTVHVRSYTRGGKKVRQHERGTGASGTAGGAAGTILAPESMGQFSPKVQHAILKTVQKRMAQDGVDLQPATIRGNLGRLWNDAFSNHRREFETSRHWYRDANEFSQGLAAIHGTDPRRAAGVLAALSPQTAWGLNKEMAHSLMAVLGADPKVGGKRLSDMSPEQVGRNLTLMAHPTHRVTQGGRAGEKSTLFAQSVDNIAKATRLYRGEDPDGVLGNGPKVRSFFNNLLLPDRATSWTDDTHMRRIHLQDPKISNQDGLFKRVFGSSPTLKAEGYNRSWGTYPYYAQQARDEASSLGVLPHELQAVTWTRWRAQHGQKGGDSMREFLSEKQLIESLRGAEAASMNL